MDAEKGVIVTVTTPASTKGSRAISASISSRDGPVAMTMPPVRGVFRARDEETTLGVALLHEVHVRCQDRLDLLEGDGVLNVDHEQAVALWDKAHAAVPGFSAAVT